MSARNTVLLRGVIGLLLIWGIVFAVVQLAGLRKPTVERLAAYQEKNPLSEISDPAERKVVITRVAEMLNGMEPSEVSRLEEREERDPRRDFYQQLEPGEQLYFMEQRVGRAFQQMMLSFNEMERDERKKLVDRALRQMRERGGFGPGGTNRLEEGDPEIAEKIAEAGLQSYYSDASVETKIDLAPLMEELQGAMSRLGGPGR